jgi:atypical dual specificity phosphatase
VARLRNYSFIHPGLAGSARPGSSSGDVEDDLKEALADGITAVVSLTESPLDEELLSRLGLRYFHLPIEDFTAPDLDTIAKYVRFVDAEIASGGKVLTHCAAGIGRTGTMLAAWLASREGFDGVTAIQQLRRLRPGSVETDAQINIIKQWADQTKRS